MDVEKKPVVSYIANRASEPTTWAGIIGLAASAYLAFQAGDLNGAVAAGMTAVTSLFALFTKERKK